MKKLEDLILTYKDFPKKGIEFKDVLEILQYPDIFHDLILKMSSNQLLKNAEAMIKGDENHQEIAAASIVAKYFRDQLMLKYAKEYEGYFFEKNKGYPTKDHKNAINYLGLSNIHRKSFKI